MGSSSSRRSLNQYSTDARCKRSQCAFLNVDTEAHLLHTIAHAHGATLRTHDSKCKPFVCRIRRVEDDAKSGVGAQRGGGLHRAWVQRFRQPEFVPSAGSAQGSAEIPDEAVRQRRIPRAQTGESVEVERTSAESHNTASTDSDFFEEHFPRVGCSSHYARAHD